MNNNSLLLFGSAVIISVVALGTVLFQSSPKMNKYHLFY